MTTPLVSVADRVQASDLRRQGVDAINAGKYDLAMRLYGESLALNPFHPFTYAERSIACALARKDLDRALVDAEKSLELKVTARGYRARGMILMELDRLDDALVAFTEGLKIVGDHANLHGLLLEDEGLLFNAMGDKAFATRKYAEAANLYGNAHNCWPTIPRFLANRSAARRMLQQWDLAIADAEESLRLQHTVCGYLEKARTFFGQRRYAEAITVVDTGLALDEADEQLQDLKVDILNQQAIIAQGVNDHEKVIELCTAVLKIHPDSRCLALRAWYRRLNPIAALQDAEESLCIKSTAFGYRVKGTVLNDMKRYKEAIVAFDAGLAIGGPLVNSKLEIGKEYAMEMQDRVEKALVLCGRAMLAMIAGDYDRAIRLYSKALGFDPSSATIWYSRGSAWLAKQDWNRALQDAQKSIERSPTVDGYCIMAKALRSTGRYAEAVEAFEAAANLRDGLLSDSAIHACIEQDTASVWLEKWQATIEHRDYKQSEEFLTTALAFSPCDAMLYARRSHARIKQERWVEVSHDAEKCLYWQPCAVVGYVQKFKALCGAKDWDAAIEIISTAVKASRLPDVLNGKSAIGKVTLENEIEVSLQGWRDPDQVAMDILRMADDITLAMPSHLFDTSTGQLCERDKIFTTFRESNDYKNLLALAASGQFVDQPTIKHRVESFFQYTMLSHRWDRSRSEPVRQDIIASVYSLDKPRGVEKLQKFCRTAKELGYRWAWSDTCCIDKTSSTETQKSITSMATWYRRWLRSQ